MKTARILIGIIVATTLACGVLAEEQESASLTKDVRCAELSFARSVEQGDREAFEQLLASDARFVGTRLLRGPAEILREWEPFFEPDYPQLIWRPETVDVLAEGRMALSRGPYLLTVRDSQGALREHWGYYHSIWRRSSDDQWRIQFDMGQPRNDDLPHDVRERLERPLATLLKTCHM